MVALGVTAGVALPALAVGAFVAGPFAPLVIAIGLIFAVGTVATITGLAFKVNALNHEVDSKKNQKEALETQLANIQKTRQELQDLGKTLKEDVAGIVGIINTAWKYCQNDAVEIKRWLEAGKGDTDIPPYMALQLGKADGIYSIVGKYLQKYADCLADTQ
ncbi:hypothetical protein DL770_009445 [Monosporascus sp. CRB-9-2]|nr:hypothetical protein DL770_009445 [Monosporascus sp. CRB-9-2]